ncbi:MAG: hypothetical protein AAGF93_20735 [Cyanobacteria bacterium P01_H01_bin.105]
MMRRPMKNAFNISPLRQGATCSLCQDTLLRHISQSKMFWYCPSCRQEMVCEEGPTTLPEATTTRISPVIPQRKLTKMKPLSKPLRISAT